MLTRVVYLIRHGAVRYPIDTSGERLVYGPEVPLSDEGQQACKQLAQTILRREGAALELIITSPYTRASQTARILSEQMAAPDPIQDVRLRDTSSNWEGVKLSEFIAVFKAGQTFEDKRTLESLSDLAERMQAAFAGVLLHDAKRLAIVSHGDPLRTLYFHLLYPQEPLPGYTQLVRMLSLEAAQAVRLVCDPAGSYRADDVLVRDERDY